MKKMILVLAVVAVSTIAVVAEEPANENRPGKKEMRKEMRNENCGEARPEGRPEKRGEKREMLSNETRAMIQVDRLAQKVGDLSTKEREALYTLFLQKGTDAEAMKATRETERTAKREAVKADREKFEASLKSVIAADKYAKYTEAMEARAPKAKGNADEKAEARPEGNRPERGEGVRGEGRPERGGEGRPEMRQENPEMEGAARPEGRRSERGEGVRGEGRPERGGKENVYTAETRAMMRIDKLVQLTGELTTKERKLVYKLCLETENANATMRAEREAERTAKREAVKADREKFEASVKSIIGEEKFAKIAEAKKDKKAEPRKDNKKEDKKGEKNNVKDAPRGGEKGGRPAPTAK
ncbi:MAG: hypothetical protein R3Y59_03205 [bacterium]